MKNLKKIINLSALAVFLFIGCKNDGGGNNIQNTGNGEVYSEGTQDSPLALSAGTPYSGKVGGASQDNISYYTFTTTHAGVYLISISGMSDAADLSIDMFNDSQVWIAGADDYLTTTAGEVLTTTALPASAIYNLQVLNYSSINISYTITVTFTPSNNEGSKTAPLALALGTPLNSGVGGAPGSDTSYYSFTTGAAASYTVQITNMSIAADLAIDLYNNGTFTGWVDGADNLGSSITGETLNTIGLSGSTTYYIEIFNYDYWDVNYDITVY